MSFYPDKPTRYHRISKIMKLTGWKPKTIYWQDRTVCDYKDRGPGINRQCRDIRKSTVDLCFTQAFGYSSFVDPSGRGRAVVKSEKNYVHDGRVVELPVDLEEGQVCQRLIDTKSMSGYVDARPVIVDGKVVCSMWKQHPHRFNYADSALFMAEEPPFTGETIGRIEHFCQLIGMDYGELDMLFDDGQGRWYIIDANKTPGGASKVEGLGEKFINAHRRLFI